MGCIVSCCRKQTADATDVQSDRYFNENVSSRIYRDIHKSSSYRTSRSLKIITPYELDDYRAGVIRRGIIACEPNRSMCKGFHSQDAKSIPNFCSDFRDRFPLHIDANHWKS